MKSPALSLQPLRLAFRPLFPAILVASLTALPLALNGCSKEDKGGSAPTPSSDLGAELVSGDSLVKLAPTDALGIFHFDLQNDAYKKFAQSAWGSSSFWLKNMEIGSEGFLAAVNRAGFNITDPNFVVQNIQQSVAFAGVSTGPEKNPYLAVITKGTQTANFAEKLKKLQEELKKEGLEIKEEKATKGLAFSLKEASATVKKADRKNATGEEAAPEVVSANKTIFVINEGDLLGVSNDLAALDAAMNGTNGKAATLLASAGFKQATQGFPGGKSRFAVGYIDLKKLIQEGGAKLKEGSAGELDQIPLSGFSWAMAMQDSPSNSFRLIYDPMDEKHKAIFSSLNASPADKLFKAVPNDPLLFVSIDGTTIRRLKDMALADGQIPPQVKSELAVIDTIQRFGIAARMAPVGQSMLPIPDLTIMFESSDPTQLAAKIAELASTWAQASGVPGLDWKDKQIGNQTVKAMISPFGFGVFLAKTENLVVAESTEAQLKAILSGAEGGAEGSGVALASAMTGAMKDKLSKEKSVGNIYLNFNEAGSLMQNMGGLLAMYAPQSEEAKKLLSPESISEVKRMGMMIGTVTLQEGIVEFESSYQPVAQGEKKAA